MATRLLGVESLERRLVLQGGPLADVAALTGPARDSSPAEVARAEQVMILHGFSLQIEGTRGSDTDGAWETCRGGALRISFEPSGKEPVELDSPSLRGPLARHLGPLGDEIARAFAWVTGKASPGGNETSYEVLENGAGKIKIEITGCSSTSAELESITVEDLVIDERELTTGADWDYRVYGPGDAHYGSITLHARADGESGEGSVAMECANASIRSTIVGKRDGSEARRFNFFDSFPTRWDSGDFSPTSRTLCHSADSSRDDGADLDPDPADRRRNPQTDEEILERVAEFDPPPSLVDNVLLEARPGRNPQTGKEIRIAAVQNAPLPPFADEVVDDVFAALGGSDE